MLLAATITGQVGTGSAEIVAAWSTPSNHTWGLSRIFGETGWAEIRVCVGGGSRERMGWFCGGLVGWGVGRTGLLAINF